MTTPKAFVGNAADEDQVRDAGRKVKTLRERELEDVRFVLSDVRGRRFYWRYLKLCRIFALSFTGDNETFFREGQRDIGLRLLGDLNEATPAAYAVMKEENERMEDKDA